MLKTEDRRLQIFMALPSWQKGIKHSLHFARLFSAKLRGIFAQLCVITYTSSFLSGDSGIPSCAKAVAPRYPGTYYFSTGLSVRYDLFVSDRRFAARALALLIQNNLRPEKLTISDLSRFDQKIHARFIRDYPLYLCYPCSNHYL